MIDTHPDFVVLGQLGFFGFAGHDCDKRFAFDRVPESLQSPLALER